MSSRALVLGAGLQGVCAALALRQAGWDVDLVDRAAEPLLGASLQGEGKVHLGLVYANEPSRRTACLMIDGALSFSGLIDRWLATPVDWAPLLSTPFHYGVLPGSLVEPAGLRAHYEWVANEVSTRVAAGEDYLGTRPEMVVEELPSPVLPGVAAPMQAAFRTDEVAVELRRLRPTLIASLVAAGVGWHPGVVVEGVRRTSSGFVVEATHAGEPACWDADVVVNCLWDGRLAVDATLGLLPSRPWVFRLKQSVEGRLPTGVGGPTSTTFVLGPYGDTVVRSSGAVYASWYPACLAGWTSEPTPPPSWRPLMDGTLDADAQAAHAARIAAAFGEVVPALRQLDVERLSAGVIFAWGEQDIDDPASELHSREAVGVHAHDGYFSIDTGKLTTAPLFADRLLALL